MKEKVKIVGMHIIGAVLAVATLGVSVRFVAIVMAPVILLCILPWRKEDCATIRMPAGKLITSTIILFLWAYGKTLGGPETEIKGAVLGAFTSALYIVPQLLNCAYGYFALSDGRVRCSSVRTLFRVIEDKCDKFDVRIVFFRNVLCFTSEGKTSVVMELPPWSIVEEKRRHHRLHPR